MRRSRLALPLVYAGALIAACSDDGTSAIVLGMTVPQGLLDDATQVDLEVIPGSASCDEATGRISGSFDTGEVESFTLQREGCVGGASWCRDITLERDGEPRVFNVVAQRAGEVLGRGCAKVAIDKDPVEVAVGIVPDLPDRCCNDGVVQLGEQCDNATPADLDCGGNPVSATQGSCGGVIPDAVCECDCLSKEVLVSAAGTMPTLSAENKGELALAFAGPSGVQANTLRAVFTDYTTADPDLNFRVFGSDLYLPSGDPRFAQQLRVPMTTTASPTSCPDPTVPFTRPLDQKEPAIARISDNESAIVWADDSSAAGVFRVAGTVLTNLGCTDQAPEFLEAAAGPSVSVPAVAGGPTGDALVVWAEGGAVRGRIWTPPMVYFPEMAEPALDLGTQLPGERPKVAGSASGWVVVYTGASGGGDIKFKMVSSSGDAGPEETANLVTDGVQDQPDVAMLPDGRFAIVWHSGEDIFFQRFDASGDPIAGDQEQPASDTSPPAERPRVAASVAAGSFFAAAWITPVTGQVWGRMIDGSSSPPFRRNHVNGLLSDFVANHPAVQVQRADPAVAIGTDHVVFGWTAALNSPPIVVVRRLPHPVE